MADPLYELLAPHFDNAEAPPAPRDPGTTGYLARLSTLSFADLTSTEPASLLQSAQSHLRNLQALSKRSHKAVITSSTHLNNLSSLLPSFASQAQTLSQNVPALETAATEFAEKYDRSTENAVLDRRKRAALLSRNVDRVSDVLDLPSLLSSTVAAAQNAGAGGSGTASSSTSYASALDLHAHIRRLKALYPQSDLVASIQTQSEDEMQNLATILITSLQSPSLKLAAAMRTIGLLRRVAPELGEDDIRISRPAALTTRLSSLSPNATNNDGALGSLLLICRLHTLHATLDALEPLRELADQETTQRQTANGTASKQLTSNSTSLGTQSERYLKRYIEIFREQSFAILSMYKGIFPGNLPEADPSTAEEHHKPQQAHDPLLPLPSPVSSFALHLVDMLEKTLREYLPNVGDESARESLLTQVLYCGSSLGRLGAEFGMMVALLEEDMVEEAGGDEEAANEPEWVAVMKKHRVQASRLEVLARGVGTNRKTSMDVQSPLSPMPA